MAYTDQSTTFIYKGLLTYQQMDANAENDKYFKTGLDGTTATVFAPSGAWTPSGAWVPSGNWGPTGDWTFTPDGATVPVTIIQGNNNIGLKIDTESADFDALQLYGKKGLYVSQDLSGGRGVYVVRNIAEAGSNPLAGIYDLNASSTQPALVAQHHGTGVADFYAFDFLSKFRRNNDTYGTFRIWSDSGTSDEITLLLWTGTNDNTGTNMHQEFNDGDGTALGSITSSGGVVTFNGATIGHPSIERNDKEYPYGYVMINSETFHDIGFAKIHPGTESHQPERIVEPSTKECDKRVFGIYGGRFDKEKCQIYAVGDGYVLVCDEGGNIVNGDYICTSNTTGHGMKQDDDLLHNYTVAKALEDVDWSNESKKVKLIACTYHAA